MWLSACVCCPKKDSGLGDDGSESSAQDKKLAKLQKEHNKKQVEEVKKLARQDSKRQEKVIMNSRTYKKLPSTRL